MPEQLKPFIQAIHELPNGQTQMIVVDPLTGNVTAFTGTPQSIQHELDATVNVSSPEEPE